MGVVLVATGVMLLFAQLNNKAVLDFAIKWWPLIFILLGGEVLWHTYSAKEENPKVKYDLFSIIIIFLVVISGLGVQALTEIGIIPRLSKVAFAQEYLLKKPYQEISLEGIKRIVLNSPRCELVVHAGEGNSVLATATAIVKADCQETAEKLIEAGGLVSRRAGDTLFLYFSQPLSPGELSYYARITEYNLVIPGDRKVEINSDFPVRIFADKLKGNWLIDGKETEVRVPEDADLKIEALVWDRSDLGGTVDWKITEPMAENDEAGQSRESKQVKGEAVLGNGKYKINVFSRSRLVVNKIN